MKSKKNFWYLIITMISCLAFSQVYAQSVPSGLKISGVDVTGFPQIRVHTHFRDAAGRIMPVTDSENCQVIEDGQPVSDMVVTSETADLNLVFIIEPGDGAFNTGVRLSQVYIEAKSDILSLFADMNWVQPDGDQFAVLVEEAGATHLLIPPTDDIQLVESSLNDYVPDQDGFIRVEDYGFHTCRSLESGLNIVQEMQQVRPDASPVIILFTPGMQQDLPDIAIRAIDRGVPIHIVLSHNEPTVYWSMALEPLAAVTGGVFRTRYGNPDMRSFFSRIQESRRQQVFSFQSRSDREGPREILIECVFGEKRIWASRSYQMILLPPIVEIEFPGDNEHIQWVPVSAVEGSSQHTNPLQVLARVRFPDGHVRELLAAVLYVDGVASAQASGRDGLLEFSWDISAYTDESGESVTLQVEITDANGLRGVSNPVMALVGPAEKYSQSGGEGLNWIVYVTALATLVLAGAVLYLFLQRDRFPGLMRKARDRVSSIVERVTGHRSVLEPLAFLVPLEGFNELPSKPYELYGTTAIGRSRKHADLLFHIGQDESPISRLHLTILDEDDHFAVRDEDSSNGTLHNGEKIPPLHPVRLYDRDIIDIAPLERGGIRLMFTLAGEQVSDEFGGTRQTRPQADFPGGLE